ncbi:unnamed protein product [Rodentolepis nana]|uniref:Transposase n=1 Tax=Rodentolepis nana TaxID=102285 RepID=A0A0R3TFP0_RODNA|nr:unnamed protein product [Rodentolepis nana]
MRRHVTQKSLDIGVYACAKFVTVYWQSGQMANLPRSSSRIGCDQWAHFASWAESGQGRDSRIGVSNHIREDATSLSYLKGIEEGNGIRSVCLAIQHVWSPY